MLKTPKPKENKKNIMAKTKAKTKNKKKPEKGKLIKVTWGTADNLPALYSNQLFISHGSGDVFHLIFGHLTPPVGFSPEEYPDSLEVEPIAKIVVSPETMETFIEAMVTNIERYKKKAE